jgi:membrane protease YdiL (CAAX protease family)
MNAVPIAGWAFALAVVGAASLAAPPADRPWARRAAALLALYLISLVLAGILLPAASLPWATAIASSAVLLTAQPFIALGVLSRAEVGLCAPRAGTARAVGLAIGLALGFNIGVMLLRGAVPVTAPPALMGAVLIAAALEELAFRGVLLALLDRALPPRWNVLGAPIGWGGVVLTAAFVALHGLRAGMLLGIVPAALLYLWLRARTGSLLAPIAAHLAWNLSVVLVN